MTLLAFEHRAIRASLLMFGIACTSATAFAQKTTNTNTPADPMATVPRLAALVARASSDLAPVVERYTVDQQSLSRRYDASDSPDQRRRMRSFAVAWRARLREVDFEHLNQEGRADYVLLDNQLKHQVAVLDRDDRKRGEAAPLLPFSDRLLALQDIRRDLVPVEPAAAARTLAQVTRVVDSMRVMFEPAPAPRGGATDSTLKPRVAPPKVSRTVANRVAENIDQLRGIVTNWYRYYDGYDPQFTWWVKSPYARLDSALTRYARTLRERVVGIPAAVLVTNTARAGGAGAPGAGAGPSNDGPIIGDPIGAEGLKEISRTK